MRPDVCTYFLALDQDYILNKYDWLWQYQNL